MKEGLLGLVTCVLDGQASRRDRGTRSTISKLGAVAENLPRSPITPPMHRTGCSALAGHPFPGVPNFGPLPQKITLGRFSDSCRSGRLCRDDLVPNRRHPQLQLELGAHPQLHSTLGRKRRPLGFQSAATGTDNHITYQHLRECFGGHSWHGSRTARLRGSDPRRRSLDGRGAHAPDRRHPRTRCWPSRRKRQAALRSS